MWAVITFGNIHSSCHSISKHLAIPQTGEHLSSNEKKSHFISLKV